MYARRKIIELERLRCQRGIGGKRNLRVEAPEINLSGLRRNATSIAPEHEAQDIISLPEAGLRGQLPGRRSTVRGTIEIDIVAIARKQIEEVGAENIDGSRRHGPIREGGVV